MSPKVAFIILPAEHLHDPAAVRRFTREMEAVGKLAHPNIVSALDAGEVDGSHYLVMELIDGINLSNLVGHHGQLPVADACQRIRQAALGLQRVHECGLVHRDSKPRNLMLAVGQDSRPTLGDDRGGRGGVAPAAGGNCCCYPRQGRKDHRQGHGTRERLRRGPLGR